METQTGKRKRARQQLQTALPAVSARQRPPGFAHGRPVLQQIAKQRYHYPGNNFLPRVFEAKIFSEGAYKRARPPVGTSGVGGHPSHRGRRRSQRAAQMKKTGKKTAEKRRNLETETGASWGQLCGSDGRGRLGHFVRLEIAFACFLRAASRQWHFVTPKTGADAIRALFAHGYVGAHDRCAPPPVHVTLVCCFIHG